jgi:hypothetical protein
LLNLACPLEFFLLLLQRDGPFLDSLFQLLVALFQLSLEFFDAVRNNVRDHHYPAALSHAIRQIPYPQNPPAIVQSPQTVPFGTIRKAYFGCTESVGCGLG